MATEQTTELTPNFSSNYTNNGNEAYAGVLSVAKPDISESEENARLGRILGQNARDLQSQIRSEIGQDGNETYFENYVSLVKCGLTNFISYRNEYHHSVLGSHAEAMILGSTQLYHILGSTRMNEAHVIQDLNENFSATTYKDATTTAGGWGTGSLVFKTTGSYALFSTWKDNHFEQTYFDKIRIEPTFTMYNPNVVFRASFNSGSNYTIIYPLIESTISPVGSDFRLEITDTSGSVILDNIYITTKGQNF